MEIFKFPNSEQSSQSPSVMPYSIIVLDTWLSCFLHIIWFTSLDMWKPRLIPLDYKFHMSFCCFIITWFVFHRNLLLG